MRVPLCRLTETKHQQFNLDTCKKTSFQINTIKEISDRENFDFFVINNKDEIMPPDYKGPVYVWWYTKDNNLNVIRIGSKKILIDEVRSEKINNNLELTHEVYVCRCK